MSIKISHYLQFALLSLVLLPTQGLAFNDIVGVASVIDGDTVEVHNTRIRLHGIDSPESNQLCTVNEEA